MQRTAAQVCEAIDDLMPAQIEVRNSDGKLRPIAEAARAKQNGMVLPAAEALLDGLRDRDTVVISSGWLIDYWFPKGELCGMVGAVGLVRFFALALGKKVLFPTEEELVPVVQALIRAAGIRDTDWEDFVARDLPQACVIPFPKDSSEADVAAQHILDTASPGGLITVEKCGPAPSGIFHTGRGTDMSATTAKVDRMVEVFRKNSIPTVGVGDLGNEIGFGVIDDETREIMGEFATCRCGCDTGMVTATATDVLVVASSSNRGAMGLEGGLGALTGRAGYVRDGEVEKSLIRAATREGAIDSFTVHPSFTDGHAVPGDISAGWVDIIRYMAGTIDQEFPMFAVRN